MELGLGVGELRAAKEREREVSWKKEEVSLSGLGFIVLVSGGVMFVLG